MLKPTIFREYDIRGIADSELQSAEVEQLDEGMDGRSTAQGSNLRIC